MAAAWTKERTEQLRKLYAEGCLSLGLIAIELGVSRNACIGMAARLGLKRERAPRQLKPQKPSPVRKTRFVNHGNRFDSTDAQPPELPILREVIDAPAAQRRTLLELTSGVCKWPIGDVGTPGFYFCGGDAADGKPYCVGHCRVAYGA
jgi:GcrA cell cycle regulator